MIEIVGEVSCIILRTIRGQLYYFAVNCDDYDCDDLLEVFEHGQKLKDGSKILNMGNTQGN